MIWNCILLFIIWGVDYCRSLVHPKSKSRLNHLSVLTRSQLTKDDDYDNGDFSAESTHGSPSRIRRSVIASVFSLQSCIQQPRSAYANNEINSIDLDFLAQLAPVATGCVRIYLCRHGETENNRLGLIQGARVDPPINPTGAIQAQRLGEALRRAVPPAEKIFYSPLTRSRQTAQIAAQAFSADQKQAPTLKLLPFLGEIDFGPLAEGKPVNQFRAEMASTYAAWAIGNIDARMMDGGESGREVLLRVEHSLNQLVAEARHTESGAVAAVAHSGYLRILLSIIQDVSLIEGSKIGQKNACINVLDLKGDGTNKAIGTRNRLFILGALNEAPTGFSLHVPEGRAILVNEQRHLSQLMFPASASA